MALTFQSPFPQTIKTAAAVITAANASRLAPATVTKLVTAGADGALLTNLEFTHVGDVTATEIQIYASTDAGANKRLIRSVLMPAQTAAVTTKRQIVAVDGLNENAPIYLQAAEEIYIGLGVAQSFGIVAHAAWGNY